MVETFMRTKMEIFLRKAISLICFLCVITGANGEYESCKTPSGSMGNCIPLSACRSLSKLAANKLITQEHINYLRNSVCGPVSKNPPVCCPVQNQSLSGAVEKLSNIEDACYTPHGGNGKCVFLKSCIILFDIARKQTHTIIESLYLQMSKCGDANGEILVCCPNELTAQIAPHTTKLPTPTPITMSRLAIGLEASTSCPTPHNTLGKCLPIEDCYELYSIILQEKVTPDERNLLKNSKCGAKYERNVCCPQHKPIERSTSKPVDETNVVESCRTPDQKPGNCIEIEKCPPLKAMILKDEITTIETKFLLNSKCGESNSPNVCCPKQNKALPAPSKVLSRTFVFPDSQCNAANGMPGICKIPKDCPNAKEFVQNNQCDYLGGDLQICCPINKLENDLLLPGMAEIIPLAIRTTPLPEISYEAPCGKTGKCISIKSCRTLLEIVTKQARTASETLYLQKSQCGYANGEFLVCCPKTESTTTTASHTTTTQATTPQTTTTTTTTKRPTPVTSTISPDIVLPIENSNKWTNEPECGRTPLQSRIFGGSAVGIDEYPWAARLIYVDSDNNMDFFCGGSLINKNYVLTAAHCVVLPEDKSDWYIKGVRLGEWNITTEVDCQYFTKRQKLCAPPLVDIDISDYIIHPMYSKKRLNYDIALLKLEESVTYTNFLRPICLPLPPAGEQTISYENEDVEIVGWGKTETGEHSEVKLLAHLKVRDINKCGLRRGTNENQICAKGAKGTDSCNGDSGGPLMLVQSHNGKIAYYLIGVISFGSGGECGDTQTNGIYMRVVNFMDWIAKNTQNLSYKHFTTF